MKISVADRYLLVVASISTLMLFVSYAWSDWGSFGFPSTKGMMSNLETIAIVIFGVGLIVWSVRKAFVQSKGRFFLLIASSIIVIFGWASLVNVLFLVINIIRDPN